MLFHPEVVKKGEEMLQTGGSLQKKGNTVNISLQVELGGVTPLLTLAAGSGTFAFRETSPEDLMFDGPFLGLFGFKK